MKKKAPKNTYWEKLKDPRWQKMRLEVMQLAKFSCQSCGASDKTLNVHHKAYKKNANPWDYHCDELACLCEDCHAAEHEIDEILSSALYEYKVDSGGLGLSKERLIGYLEAPRWGEGPWAEWMAIRGHEHASGIADYFAVRPTKEEDSNGIDSGDLIYALAVHEGDNYLVSWQEFLWHFFYEERSSYYLSLEEREPGFLEKMIKSEFYNELPASVQKKIIALTGKLGSGREL